MSKRGYISGGLALALGLLAFAPAGSTLASQNAQEQAGPTVVASGLASPRGLAAGSDGALYVAESGSGGDEVVKVGEGDQQSEVHRGFTGQVSRIMPDGTKSVVAGNLPSTGSSEGEAVGPEGVTYANGALWVTVSGAEPGLTARPMEGSVLRIDPQSGDVKTVANIQDYENANNPDGFVPDSNPYGLAFGPDGMLYVADAAGNALYKLDPSSGKLSVVTVFDGLPLPPPLQGQGPFAQGNPERNGKMEIDPVPTGVTIGPDGNVYVGLLSGFPFLEGFTKVLRVTPGGNVSEAAAGLTMVVDVEFGPDGMLYASEFGQFSFTSGPPGFAPNSGKVVRIMPNGAKEVVAQNLNETNGIAFDASGNLYAVVNSTSLTNGQVVRLGNMAGGMVGMPRTGEGFSLNQSVYLSLLLIVGGCAVLLTSSRFAGKRNSR